MPKAYTNHNPLMQDESPDVSARRTWGGDPPAELQVSKREKIELVDIDAIQPDPRQPRRAIPSAVRSVYPSADAQALIGHWFDLSGAAQLDIKGLIEGTYELPEDFAPGALLGSFLRLVDLAGSIRRDGLINPITAGRDPSTGYFDLETGERRWLAYHLLHSIYGDDYARIPARIMPALDVWRQATENNARDDLNAIGRARQLALLLMDVLGIDQFQPLEAFEHEQAYYAQVADGETWRTPRGAAPKIIAAMGLRNVRQLRQYRALLRLPREIWVQADDENWTEYNLRELDDTATVVAVSNDDPPPPLLESSGRSKAFVGRNQAKSNSQTSLPGFDKGDISRLKRLSKWGEHVHILNEEDRKRKLTEVGAMLMTLEEIKRRLGG